MTDRQCDNQRLSCTSTDHRGFFQTRNINLNKLLEYACMHLPSVQFLPVQKFLHVTDISLTGRYVYSVFMVKGHTAGCSWHIICSVLTMLGCLSNKDGDRHISVLNHNRTKRWHRAVLMWLSPIFPLHTDMDAGEKGQQLAPSLMYTGTLCITHVCVLLNASPH